MSNSLHSLRRRRRLAAQKRTERELRAIAEKRREQRVNQGVAHAT